MDGASPILEFRRVEKRFGRVRALAGIDLEVRPGELVALLGAVGAGSSTVVKLAAGLLGPDRGTVALFGRDLQKADRSLLGRVGFVFDAAEIDARLSVAGHLRYRAGLLGLGRSDASALAGQVLARFRLAERREDSAGVLSGVGRRQLALAVAALGAPALLVADGSADGIDPDERSAVLDPLLRLRAEDGAGILLATSEPAVAASADRVVVLHRGAVVFEGAPAALAAAGAGDIAAGYAVLMRAGEREATEA